MRVKYATLALAALLLVCAASVYAQGPGTAASPATPKVGVLNVRQAIIGSAEGKQASAELQSQFAPRQTELENLRRQIEDAQNRLRTGDRTLSDEEKARIARQADQWSRQFQRKQEDLQEDLRAAEGEVIDRIGGKMMEVLDRYARENGFSVIFDVSAQTTSVVYASNEVNITQDIIRLYDQAHPIKGAAPAQARPQAQPGQTRPPQPPPKPPQQ